MQDGLNSVTNLVHSVGYEASTANQSKQLKIFDSRNHRGLSFLCLYYTVSVIVLSRAILLGSNFLGLRDRYPSVKLTTDGPLSMVEHERVGIHPFTTIHFQNLDFAILHDVIGLDTTNIHNHRFHLCLSFSLTSYIDIIPYPP